jgi:hypothetical protein
LFILKIIKTEKSADIAADMYMAKHDQGFKLVHKNEVHLSALAINISLIPIFLCDRYIFFSFTSVYRKKKGKMFSFTIIGIVIISKRRFIFP